METRDNCSTPDTAIKVEITVRAFLCLGDEEKKNSLELVFQMGNKNLKPLKKQQTATNSTYEISSVEITPAATETFTINRGTVIMEALDSGGIYSDRMTPSVGE